MGFLDCSLNMFQHGVLCRFVCGSTPEEGKWLFLLPHGAEVSLGFESWKILSVPSLESKPKLTHPSVSCRDRICWTSKLELHW